jgi:hypothetical protein
MLDYKDEIGLKLPIIALVFNILVIVYRTKPITYYLVIVY